MNNSKMYLAFLLLLAPACKVFKKKPKMQIETTGVSVPISQEEYNQNEITTFDYITPEEQRAYNQNLDAFVLSEEDNRFNAGSSPHCALSNRASESDLEFAYQEQGDPYADSAAHGLKAIYYDFGKHGIRPDQEASLEHDYALVENLANKDYTIVCEGHACNSAGSSDARNITISEERPQHVADYLVAKGVKSENIKVVGRGAEMKIVPSGDRVQQAPNRRVELYAYRPESRA